MSASVETRDATTGTSGGSCRAPSYGARRAPSCGARTRAGGSCLGLAMASGRCRLHGGASTGPRTAVGLARMVAAKTTHGRTAMSGAPQRLAQRCVRTFIARARLTAEATELRAYLPAGMAARLDRVPDELIAPKHPSQVAFETLAPLTPCNCLPVGLGRRALVARTRLSLGGEVVDGAAAVVVRGRAAERLATRAETATQARWRAAIAAARALKHAIDEARGQMRDTRNDPTRGSARGHQTPDGRNDPIRGNARGQTRGASNDPIGGAGGKTRGTRNDPIHGLAARVRAAGAPLDTRVGVLAEQRAGETTEWAPGSPGLREALAREVEKRPLRAAVGLRGNDPIRGRVAGADAGDGARVAPGLTGVGSARSLALGSTTLARTWEPSVGEVLAARFGPAADEGWLAVAVAPLGIAAMPSGRCAQRPYMRSTGLGTDRGGQPVGRVIRR